MPSRPFTLLILVFWAAMTGWLVYADVWPRLQPGEPPPFTIDLADEASASVQKSFWTLFQDGVNVGRLEVGVKYRFKDDTFEIPSQMSLHGTLLGHKVDVQIESVYRVTRDGELRELAADGRVPAFGVAGHLDGTVKDRWFVRHFWVEGPVGKRFEPDLPPVEVSHRGSIFNPNQPVNKLRGLRPGQRWRIPQVDPAMDIVRAAISQSFLGVKLPDPPVLQAEVLPTVQALPQLALKPVDKTRAFDPRRSGVPCLVIQYTGDDVNARTWVRESDGLVLRQEATQHGETLILDRD